MLMLLIVELFMLMLLIVKLFNCEAIDVELLMVDVDAVHVDAI